MHRAALNEQIRPQTTERFLDPGAHPRSPAQAASGRVCQAPRAPRSRRLALAAHVAHVSKTVCPSARIPKTTSSEIAVAWGPCDRAPMCRRGSTQHRFARQTAGLPRFPVALELAPHSPHRVLRHWPRNRATSARPTDACSCRPDSSPTITSSISSAALYACKFAVAIYAGFAVGVMRAQGSETSLRRRCPLSGDRDRRCGGQGRQHDIRGIRFDGGRYAARARRKLERRAYRARPSIAVSSSSKSSSMRHIRPRSGSRVGRGHRQAKMKKHASISLTVVRLPAVRGRNRSRGSSRRYLHFRIQPSSRQDRKDERVVARRHRESHVRFLKFRPAIEYFDEGQAILR